MTNTPPQQGGADLLDAEPGSIKTGRTVEDVAASDVKIKRKPKPKRGTRTAQEQKDQPRRERSRRGLRSRVPRRRRCRRSWSPSLLRLSDKPPTGGSWVHEIKFDGYRLLARIDRGHAKLKTRSGLDWTSKFPSLKKALEALPVVTAFLDGEVVVETEKGTPSFAELQADLSEGPQRPLPLLPVRPAASRRFRPRLAHR